MNNWMFNEWKSNGHHWQIVGKLVKIRGHSWKTIEKWLIVFEIWLKFSFWDVNCHSEPTFEWWMIKLNEPLMINSPQSSSCFESRFDLPRMQQWCNTSRRQYIATSHLKNAWNKFVQWFNAFNTGAWSLQIQCKSKIPQFPQISYPSKMGGMNIHDTSMSFRCCQRDESGEQTAVLYIALSVICNI